MREKETYDPEQPPLHRIHRNHIPRIHNHIRNEESPQPKRRIEILTQQPKRPKEPLHRKERNIIEHQEPEEASGARVETCHPVDDEAEDEGADEGEGDVGEGVGEDDGGGAVEFVRGLFADDGAADHLERHFTEGVEADGEHRREDDAAACECACGGTGELNVCASDDQSQELCRRCDVRWARENMTRRERRGGAYDGQPVVGVEEEPILQFLVNLADSERTDLTDESNGVRTLLRHAALLVLDHSLTEPT